MKYGAVRKLCPSVYRGFDHHWMFGQVRIYQRVGIKPIRTEYEKSVGKKREISAFGTLYGDQLPLSIELIKPHYLFIPLIDEASQF